MFRLHSNTHMCIMHTNGITKYKTKLPISLRDTLSLLKFLGRSEPIYIKALHSMLNY